MCTFYYDYFSSLALSKRVDQPFSGGDCATKVPLLEIIKSEYYGKKDIVIIMPKNFSPRDKVEKKFFNSKKVQRIFVDSIDEIDFKDGDILFVPLVCGRELIMINHLKKIKPNLIVYGRLHDKNHNFPLDLFDRYYFSGFNRTGIPLVIEWIGKKVLFKFSYWKWISNFDKIFTVSNYSMQMLKHSNIRYLTYNYQGILDTYMNKNQKRNITDNYILFVNGGRPEKNALRTMIAFAKFKSEHPENDIYLYITSIRQDTLNNLLKKLKKYQFFDEKYFKFFGYLPYEELYSLYANANYLIFTSKGEGFGLPVLEAIMSGTPVLASWNTSIPEVAGSSVYYVDPFNIESIKKGIEFYSNNNNLEYYKNCSLKRKAIIEEQIKEDAKILVHDLFN